jgi:TPR repeat protein
MARLDMASAEMAVDGQGASGDALLQLGMMCASGRTGPIDLVSAHKWFNLAAHRGSHEAARLRRELASEMSAEDVATAQRLAREWLSMRN